MVTAALGGLEIPHSFL